MVHLVLVAALTVGLTTVLVAMATISGVRGISAPMHVLPIVVIHTGRP